MSFSKEVGENLMQSDDDSTALCRRLTLSKTYEPLHNQINNFNERVKLLLETHKKHGHGA
jgi:hypothetical protein